MENFKSLALKDIDRIILSTKKSLYICMPGLHEESVHAILKLHNTNRNSDTEIKIHILIDFDSQTFRQGYGNFESVNKLINSGFDVKCLKTNRISFIIYDNSAYYLFIESRSLIPSDKKTINAVKIDPVGIIRLKEIFFAETEISNLRGDLTNAMSEKIKQFHNLELVEKQVAPVTVISNDDIKSVSENLQRNPPIHPDFKRIVEFYTTKFQYVKVKFEGANIPYKKIEIPSKALPIRDATLKRKLETKLNLFEKSKMDDYFKPLTDFKERLTEIRDSYLTKVKSRDESLLDKLKKSEFEEKIENLKKKIDGVKTDTIKNIDDQIIETKSTLLKDLIEFFSKNPSSLFSDDKKISYLVDNKDYVERFAKSEAERIINKIKWPAPHLLLNELKLIVQYSDITYEDLRNKEFVKELRKCNLINESDKNRLAEFGKGIIINTD